MVEFYLGLASVVAVIYFGWGVYNPKSQQEIEHRLFNMMTGGSAGVPFFRPHKLRFRNTCGLVVAVVLLGVAVFGYEEEEHVRHANQREAPTTKQQQEAAQVEDALRHQAERGEAYYRTNSPLGGGSE
jgi:hypothetical protein